MREVCGSNPGLGFKFFYISFLVSFRGQANGSNQRPVLNIPRKFPSLVSISGQAIEELKSGCQGLLPITYAVTEIVSINVSQKNNNNKYKKVNKIVQHFKSL